VNNAIISDDFINHIRPLLKDESELNAFLNACQTPLRKSIRTNKLNATHQEFVKISEAFGWKLSEIPWCDSGYWIDDTAGQAIELSGNMLEHLNGQFYVQEASSMLPVSALLHNNKLSEPPVLMDVAAAPGSKTTQLAAEIDNKGLILANELSSTRIKFLSANIQRCGVTNVCMTHFDGRVFADYLPETFDAILLDAPCGGEGTVRKDVEALKNWSLDSVNQMAELQKELIESAFKILKPGGLLIYSTCTLSPEENHQVCHQLQQRYPQAVAFETLNDLFEGADKATTPDGFLHVLPHIFDSEGFFIARIRKTQSINDNEEEKPKKFLKKFPFEPANNKVVQQLNQYLKQQFGFDLSSEDKTIWQRDKELWLFPEKLDALLGYIKIDRIGVKIGDVYPKNYRLTHSFIVAFGSRATKNVCNLDQEKSQQFYLGKDLTVDTADGHGEQILTYNHKVIGLGKKQKLKIKNQLPRELVKDKL